MTVVTEIQQQRTTKHWSLDPTRSTVEFAVGTFWGLGTVYGRFHSFDGFYEAGPTGGEIALTVDAETLDTGNGTRDEHLRSWDFFDVVRHRYIRFTSNDVLDRGDGTLHIAGSLEVAGTTVPVELGATLQHIGEEVEIEARTTVDQGGFGMSKGPLGMIRTPATVRVNARLV